MIYFSYIISTVLPILKYKTHLHIIVLYHSIIVDTIVYFEENIILVLKLTLKTQ